MIIQNNFDKNTFKEIESKIFEIELKEKPVYNAITLILHGDNCFCEEDYKIIYDHGKWLIVT